MSILWIFLFSLFYPSRKKNLDNIISVYYKNYQCIAMFHPYFCEVIDLFRWKEIGLSNKEV